MGKSPYISQNLWMTAFGRVGVVSYALCLWSPIYPQLKEKCPIGGFNFFRPMNRGGAYGGEVVSSLLFLRQKPSKSPAKPKVQVVTGVIGLYICAYLKSKRLTLIGLERLKSS